jgi:hypothetical protein
MPDSKDEFYIEGLMPVKIVLREEDFDEFIKLLEQKEQEPTVKERLQKLMESSNEFVFLGAGEENPRE